jgi:hypothetical protein
VRVYHYNHYEPTSVDHLSELHETRQEAVGRLMGRYATREDEVDELFRLGCSWTCVQNPPRRSAQKCPARCLQNLSQAPRIRRYPGCVRS